MYSDLSERYFVFNVSPFSILPSILDNFKVNNLVTLAELFLQYFLIESECYFFVLKHEPLIRFYIGPVMSEFRIDRMAFGQPECTYLNIQNVPLL